MEIELKYDIESKELADKIWEDEELAAMAEEGSREKLAFKAVYFDTEDFDLSQRDIAFRTRVEGERTIATLKWGGKSEGALHTRQEINVPVSDSACLLLPDLTLFKESVVGPVVEEIAGRKQLVSLIEIGSMRRRMRIDTGNTLIEVSIDNGEIITDKGTEPICEIEFELFGSGEQEELEAIGERIAKKYDLKPEKRSKYARGLALIRGEDSSQE